MKLLDICETIVDCPHSTAKDEGTGYPLIRTPNVGKGRLKLAGVHRVSENVYNQRNERAVPQVDDLILAREAPVGNVAIIRKGQQVCLGQRTVLIRPNKKYVDPDYLVYYLLSPELQHKLLSSANGATVSHLNMSSIRSLEVQVPEIEVQKRIGAILARIDDKIELNSTINDNLEEQAKALFKSWFVDFDRNEWVHCELGDITLITAGGDRPSKYTNKKTIECHVPIYSNGIDNEGLYGYTNVAKIHEESITISARGTIGYVCLRLEPYVPIVRLISIIPNKKELSAKYLYLWALTQNITGTGTTQQQLTVPIFRKTPISIPSDTKLKQFNSIADPLFSQIESNKKENIKLSTLRDTLLPKLMSGEISVEEVSLD